LVNKIDLKVRLAFVMLFFLFAARVECVCVWLDALMGNSRNSIFETVELTEN
jgi:hypothetical protein